MVGEIRGRHPRWKDSLRLLGEFHRISLSVRITHRDLTMQTVIDRCAGEWADILTQYHQLEPPPFIPLASGNTVTNVKGSNHGAGLVRPINGTLEDWCQYAAHHFRPGGRSTPIGIGMDMVSRVSYPHMWGYLLSLILGPVTECNGVWARFFQYFAGIVARPQWYTSRWEEISLDPTVPPIEVSPLGDSFSRMEWDAHAANVGEDDVIRHLANNGVSQTMIDAAYPYGVTFIDFELSSGSVNSDYYSFVDGERHRLLAIHGVPNIPKEYAGWWVPSGSDLDRIWVLTHVSEHVTPSRHVCVTDEIKSECFRNTGSGPSHPPNHWYHFGEHYIYTWLMERPPPGNAMSGLSPHLSQYTDEDFPLTDRRPPTDSSMLTPGLDDPLARTAEPDTMMGDATEEQSPVNDDKQYGGSSGDDGFASVHDH